MTSRYNATEQQLVGLRLNTYDEELLNDTEECVLRIMKKGTPLIEQVADCLGMHPSKLRRRIKTATNVTANNYFTLVRMRHALDMMRDYPRYSITQVADRCGFADSSHFNHVFRRWFDTAPIQYVEQMKNNAEQHGL